jgi:hypothetical protein
MADQLDRDMIKLGLTVELDGPKNIKCTRCGQPAVGCFDDEPLCKGCEYNWCNEQRERLNDVGTAEQAVT